MYSYHLNQLCSLVCFLFVCSTLHYTDTLNPASILCKGWIPFYYWLKIKPSAQLQKEPLVVIGIIKPCFTFMLIPGPVTEISDNCSPVFFNIQTLYKIPMMTKIQVSSDQIKSHGNCFKICVVPVKKSTL